MKAFGHDNKSGLLDRPLIFMMPEEVITGLTALGNPENLAGMSRFGINTATALGIGISDLRRYARS
jgi:3-methyladenine DNA glycosylase AlkD